MSDHNTGRHQSVTEMRMSKTAVRNPPVMATDIARMAITMATASSAFAHTGSFTRVILSLRLRSRVTFASFGGTRRLHHFAPRPRARSSMRMRWTINHPKPIVASVPVVGAQTIAATLTISPITAT